MKRLIKSGLARCWLATHPIRDPIKVRIKRALTNSMYHAMEMHAANRTTDTQGQTNLLLEGMLTEIFRLQVQVEELQRAIESNQPLESVTDY